MMNLLHRNCIIKVIIFSAAIGVVLSFSCQTGSAQEKTAADQPVAAAATLTKEIVSNFVSGIIILVERPVQVGDIVTVGNMSGKVRRINIRATTILNFDRQEVILPNRSLITKEVTNWTRGDTINRLVISIGVAYGSDIEKVSEILMQIACEDPDVMKEPAPSVVFMQHGDSSLDFNLRVFIPSPEFIMVLRDRLNKRINREFEKHGIEIPFPQRDLHIKSSVVRTQDLTPDKGSAEIPNRHTPAKVG